MEIAVFAVAMVVVFAAKVASVVLTRDELVGKSASFNWMDARESAALPAEAEPSSAPAVRGASAPVYAGRRPGIA